MPELLDRRTRFAKHFDTGTPGVFEARITSRPQHFRTEAGDWEDMANLLQPVAGGFAATTQDVRFGIESGYLTFTYKGRSLQMRPTVIAMVDRTSPQSRFRKLADADYTSVTRDGLTVTVNNIFPQTDLTVRFTDETVSKQFTIRQRPNYPDPVALGWNPATTYLVIVWDVQKPAGAVVRDTVTLQAVGSGYVGNNDLVVEDGQGTPVLYFAKGEGWSARENAKHYPVNYVSLGAQVPFGEAFRYDKAAIATYPLTLDPTSSVYPYNSADDGTVQRNDASYGGIYTYTATNVATSGYLGRTHYDDGKGTFGATCTRHYWRFDLSSISGTCNSADLNLYQTSTAAQGTPTANILKTADWSPLDGTQAEFDISGTQIGSTSSWQASSYRTISLTASEVEASFGGTLALTGRVSGDTTYSNPAAALYVSLYLQDAAGTGNDPYLSVTYTTGGGTTNYVTLAATSTFTAAQATASTFKQTLAASSTMTPAVQRRVGINLASAQGFAAVMGRSVAKTLPVSATLSPGMQRTATKTLAATSAFSPALAPKRVFVVALAASSTMAAAMQRRVGIRLDAITPVAVQMARSVAMTMAVQTALSPGMTDQAIHKITLAATSTVTPGQTPTFVPWTPAAPSTESWHNAALVQKRK